MDAPSYAYLVGVPFQRGWYPSRYVRVNPGNALRLPRKTGIWGARSTRDSSLVLVCDWEVFRSPAADLFERWEEGATRIQACLDLILERSRRAGTWTAASPTGTWRPNGVLVPDIDPPAPKPETGGERPPARPRVNEDDRPGKVVQFIFAEVARGISPGMVAHALNGAWVPAPNGGTEWRDATVRGVARNDVYVSPGNATHEPLVGRRMFNQAQRELDKRTRGRTE